MPPESGRVLLIGLDSADAELGIWMGHHISGMINLMNLSQTEIVDYPGDRDLLLERTVRFCLRGLGMGESAIREHFHPEQLALLLPE